MVASAWRTPVVRCGAGVAGRALPAPRRLGGALDTRTLAMWPSILSSAEDVVMVMLPLQGA